MSSPKNEDGQISRNSDNEVSVENTHRCPHCGAAAGGHDPVPATKLSARRERFVQAYVTGMSATKAYEAAYGKSRGAKVSASRLLTSANVSARLRELQRTRVLSALLTRDQIRHFLYRVVVTPIGQVDHTSDLCQTYRSRGLASPGDGKSGEVSLPGGKRAQKIFSLQISMPDKLRAIELDSKLSGDWHGKSDPDDEPDSLNELLWQIRSGR